MPTEFTWTVGDEEITFHDQNKPNILICGATGSGKTTTIRTLFGSEVGEVGHYSRGTSQDMLYEWESRGRNIDIVDLPGLGDSKQRDREYKDIYRRRVEQAHAFVVVTTPPRPASLPTLRTVNLLLSCGVPPEKLVIAFNRMSLINIEDEAGLTPIVIDGLGGPAFEDEKQAVDQAREALLTDLRAGTHVAGFHLDQVIAYDALTGWNLFAVLDRIVTSLPNETVVPWRDAVSNAAEQALRQQKARTERDARRIRELEEQLADSDRQNGDVQRRLANLEKKKRRAKNNKDSMPKVAEQKKAHEGRLLDRAADWVRDKGLPGEKLLRKAAAIFRS